MDSDRLLIGDVGVPRADALTCLGSIISGTLSEIATFNHRIGCAWGTYHRWSKMLESQASLQNRINLWKKTVQPSLLWGLQTTRTPSANGGLAKLRHTQRLMFRRMLKLKRGVVVQGDGTKLFEPWLDWHKRSFRKAGETIQVFDVDINEQLDKLKCSWAGHLARMGLPKGQRPQEQRMLKSVLFFRPLAWWRDQQWFNQLGWDPVLHPARVGRPKRWEDQFSTNWPNVLS